MDLRDELIKEARRRGDMFRNGECKMSECWFVAINCVDRMIIEPMAGSVLQGCDRLVEILYKSGHTNFVFTLRRSSPVPRLVIYF